MQRTDLMDTSEWAHREIFRRLRAMTPSQRLQMVCDHTDRGRAIHKLALDRLAAKRAAEQGASDSDQP
jgi:uncharacterized protein (DUF2249 family)